MHGAQLYSKLSSKHKNGFSRTALALIATLGFSGIAHAEPADLSRMTCAQFDDLRPGDKAQFGLWLAGYYAGSAQKPQIDRTAFDGAMRVLGETCAKQKNALMIGAEVRAIFLPQQNSISNTNAGGLASSGNTIPVNPQQGGNGLTTGSLPSNSASNNIAVTPSVQNAKPAPR